MKKRKDLSFISIDELNVTRNERDQHFFFKGYEYALLHLHEGLKQEKLEGLEKTIMKYTDFLSSETVKDFEDKINKKMFSK